MGGRLWSVPIDGGAATALTPLLPAFTGITRIVASPTTSHVLFLADAYEDGRPELFVTQADGSTSADLQLLAGVLSGGLVGLPSAPFTPDGSYVLCNVRATSSSSSYAFCSVPVTGGPVVELTSGNVSDFKVSPDSQRVVISGSYSVMIGGGAHHDIASSFSDVLDYHVGTAHVLLLAQPTSADEFELYAVPIEGPPPGVKLNHPLPPQAEVVEAALSPDGTFALYSASPEVLGRNKVFRAEVTGPPDPRSFATPTPFGPLGDVVSFTVRQGRVAYVADQDVNGRSDLYGVALDGMTAPVRLNGTMVEGGEVSGHQLVPDGTRVVYLADAEVPGQSEVYVVPSDGSSPPVKGNGPLTAGTSISQYGVSPDGTRLVYVADESANPGRRLYSRPLGGGPTVSLGLTSTAGFQITPDSSRVLHLDTRLYSVPIAGGTAADLSGAVHSVASFESTSDSARAVFRAKTSSNSSTQLYSTPIGGGTRLTLNPSLVAGGNVLSPSPGLPPFTLSTGGTHVVFLADALEDEHYLLYSAPVDGSSPALLLHTADLEAVSYKTAGDRILFFADGGGFLQPSPCVAIGLDGQDPVTLQTTNPNPVPSYELTSDGQTLIVLLSGSGLYARPTDGGPPVLLWSDPGFATFRSFAGRVAFFADPSFESFQGLYDVSITGGNVRTLVAPTSRPSTPWQMVSSDRWLYIGRREDPQVKELYVGGVERLGPP